MAAVLEIIFTPGLMMQTGCSKHSQKLEPEK